MDIKLELVLQEPINYNGLIIYQPTIEDIMRFGKDRFNELLLPYCLTMDNISLNIPDKDKEKLKIFDLILMDTNLLGLFVQSLLYFCRVTFDDVKLFNDYITIKDVVINRDNFDELSDILLQINSREKMKVEKPPIFENDRQRDVWEKLQEGRKRDSQKSELHLQDVINIVEFGGKYHIPIEHIRKMTIWRLMNAYKTILNIDNYNSSFSIYLVSGEKSLIEDKHWTQQIRVG